jgi:hypothetical protein
MVILQACLKMLSQKNFAPHLIDSHADPARGRLKPINCLSLYTDAMGGHIRHSSDKSRVYSKRFTLALSRRPGLPIRPALRERGRACAAFPALWLLAPSC